MDSADLTPTKRIIVIAKICWNMYLEAIHK